MIKAAGIDLANYRRSWISIAHLGYSTGAADIFGVTGGVLRSCT